MLISGIRLNSIQPEIKALVTITVCVFCMLFMVGRLGGFQDLELRVYDYLMQAKPSPEEPAHAHPVSILLLNEDDIHRHGPYPFSDGFIAEIIQRIEYFKPRVIGLDIYRDTPTREGTENLVNTVNFFNNIIIINKFKSFNSPGVFVMPKLDNPGKVGFSDLLEDDDGIVRRGLLYLDDGQTSQRSFAMQLALFYLKPENITEAPAKPTVSVHSPLPFPGSAAILTAIPVGETPTLPRGSERLQPTGNNLQLGRAVFIPLESNDGGYVNADAGGYQFLLDFTRPLDTFRRFSVDELLGDSIDPSLIKDKVVIIGVAADSTNDDFLVPTRNASGYPQTISGTGLHGIIANQIISAAVNGQSLLRTLPDGIGAMSMLVCCLLGSLFALKSKSLSRLLLFVVIGIFLLMTIEYLGFFVGFWVPLGSAGFAWLVSSILTIAYLTYHERRQKQQALTLFGNYLSPAIAEHIWQQRDLWLQAGKPKPQKMSATILFSDIKGFTQVADQLEPDIFMDWLNEYFDAMSGIIILHDGIVVRFIGDAILAAFGIPIPRQSDKEIAEDAQKAVRCALVMEAKLAELNHRWKERNLPIVASRIGIHSGMVVSGSMGNKNHMEYTIHGDDVNIAARLETHNKESFDPSPCELLEKPCRILIGDNTEKLIRGRFELEKFGEQSKLTGRMVDVYLVRAGNARERAYSGLG